MSETPENSPNNIFPGTGPEAHAAQPTFVVLAQYLKDLSFESPNAPQCFQDATAPQMSVSIDLNRNNLGTDQYEVELSVHAKAERNGQTVFIVEAAYAGVFEIKNVSPEQLQVAIAVECPKLLFPFLRQILASATQAGNFPPLMIEPIDFAGNYMRTIAQQQQEQQAAAAADNPPPTNA